MEKVFWKGTFAEAEARDDEYWSKRTEQERLASLLEIREILFENFAAPIEKIAFKRKLGAEE